ncbi:hypothetical protein LCGC14_1937850 [marine sediment metagenome]|uniref:Uncharacterized protein n=1 Tax=marine sediment metagenome TaxID=412755 RepID=A0A0F9FLH0_9ZZZZ
MTIETRQIGVAHKVGHGVVEQSMHQRPGKTVGESLPGAVVYQERLLQFDPEFHPFLNEVNGTAMNVNASFSGIPAFIYEDGDSSDADSGTTSATTANKLEDTDSGKTFTSTVSVGMVVRNTTDTTYAHVTAIDSNTILSLDADIMTTGENYTIGAEWPGTAISGSWNFTPDISISSANDNDECRLDNPHTSVMSNYVAVTGKITLTTWDDVNNTLLLSFGLAGVLAGNSVDLNDFIDTGLLGTQQNFVIPKADLGLSTQTVDDMNLVITRTAGVKPTVDLDDIQFEKAGGSVVYRATTPKGTMFHIDELRLALAGNITGITTVAGATENATVPNLSYDKLLGVPALANGIVFTRVQDNEIRFSVTIKQLGDFLATGSNIVNHISDGINTFIALLVVFPVPIILDGSKQDFLSFTVNDDLSSLLQFTAAARGAIEV